MPDRGVGPGCGDRLLPNYGLRFPEAATSVIGPTGRCEAYLPYGQDGVLVHAIKVEDATGLIARRYAPGRYRESAEE